MKTESWIPMSKMLPAVDLLLRRLGELIGGRSNGVAPEYMDFRYWDPNRDFIISGSFAGLRDKSDPSKLRVDGDVMCVQILWFEDKIQTIFSDQAEQAPEWIYDRIQALFVLEALADL